MEVPSRKWDHAHWLGQWYMWLYISTCIMKKPSQHNFTISNKKKKSFSVSDKKKPSDRLKKVYGCRKEKKIFVNTMNYCFSSNITLIPCINKQIRNETSSMKWMVSTNTWITIIFGRESVIQLFIEIIDSIDEKKKNMIFFVDRISLYRSNR